MKVHELIEKLQKLDPNLLVIKQKDDEGNGFYKLRLVEDDGYVHNEDLTEYRPYVYSLDELVEYDRLSYTKVCVLV